MRLWDLHHYTGKTRLIPYTKKSDLLVELAFLFPFYKKMSAKCHYYRISEYGIKILHYTLYTFNTFLHIITDRIRSRREGNVFTGMCHSVYRGGGMPLPSMHHWSHDLGFCFLMRGCLHRGLPSEEGGCHLRRSAF